MAQGLFGKHLAPDRSWKTHHLLGRNNRLVQTGLTLMRVAIAYCRARDGGDGRTLPERPADCLGYRKSIPILAFPFAHSFAIVSSATPDAPSTAHCFQSCSYSRFPHRLAAAIPAHTRGRPVSGTL